MVLFWRGGTKREVSCRHGEGSGCKKIRPVNDAREMLVAGQGQSLMRLNLEDAGWLPSGSRSLPSHSKHCMKKSHFFGLKETQYFIKTSQTHWK